MIKFEVTFEDRDFAPLESLIEHVQVDFKRRTLAFKFILREDDITLNDLICSLCELEAPIDILVKTYSTSATPVEDYTDSRLYLWCKPESHDYIQANNVKSANHNLVFTYSMVTDSEESEDSDED